MALPDALDWSDVGALLPRPHAEVTWRPLPRAGIAFLDACTQGLPLEAAATCALETDPGTNFAALIGSLLDAGALTLTDSCAG